ncbi:MAG: RNA polymerase sigma factor [Candidatus Kapabacteria bacterium]|nr:RNA polymerase sigma factor [Candidatus Kapabacteria bacterium]
MNEQELYTHLQQGDSQALAYVMEVYGKTVLATCYKFLLNTQDAEDIAQEVFIEVYQSAKGFRGDAKLSTWIYRIAVSKCLDELKKRKRQKRISSIGKLLHLDEVAEWLSGGKAADADLQTQENMIQVQKALDKLPDNQRIAFTLSKIDGYTHAEIAEILQVSATAVDALIYRAKNTVSRELQKILQNSSNM